MKVYNTLTRRKEDFVSLRPGAVGFYICGPTVYNDIHIGNARTFLSFDVIRRYLEYRGYEVTYVQNITDVDDKIINRANEEGRDSSEVAEQYTEAFIAVMDALGVKEPSVRPRATAEIASMIELIEGLIQSGNAYEVEGDVYFSVRSFPSYGALSGRNVDDLKSGARVDVDERKRDPLDFALWKAAKPGEPSWPSPWGLGRPGWHIECSAMSKRYLGTAFDIHAGGDDLVFPHHENELAQSACSSKDGFASYWLHGGMLTIDKEKMSKSEGNFLLLKDVLEHVRPEALRLLMLQTHYRSPFDYSPERLEEATASLERIESALRNSNWALAQHAGAGEHAKATASLAPSSSVADARKRFEAYMDDDFNTAGAVAVVFELVSEANRLLAEYSQKSETFSESFADLEVIAQTVVELLMVLGVKLEIGADCTELVATDALPALLSLAAELAHYSGSKAAEALDALLSAREEARVNKDWTRADAVRDGLAKLGLKIEDTPHGSRIIHA
ncbi:MAG: cysteine--tRNA ligase [Coriobacteriia bacterium]|nr:cysteine--tRNA ligase [Coriobacteriia bacterium]